MKIVTERGLTKPKRGVDFSYRSSGIFNKVAIYRLRQDIQPLTIYGG